MLQRSPGYMLSLPSRDPFAERVRALVPANLAYFLVRWKNIAVSLSFYQLCRRAPGPTRRRLIDMIRGQLPDGYPVEVDFSPRYNPWDERLCVVRDGDLFACIKAGRASVITGSVATFTERGVRLGSGEEIGADVIVTATGLDLLAFGGIALSVDGHDVDPGHTFLHRGFMLGGVPNLAVCIGYTNASWTLRADLASRRVCDLLNHLRRRGRAVATPPVPDAATAELPLLDLRAGYVARSAERMPKRSRRGGWKLRQNYPLDLAAYRLRGVGAGLALSGSPTAAGDQTLTSESSVPKSLATYKSASQSFSHRSPSRRNL